MVQHGNLGTHEWDAEMQSYILAAFYFGYITTTLLGGILALKVQLLGKEKEMKEYLYNAFILRIISKRSVMDHTLSRANTPCLPFLRSVHQMSPPPTEVTDIQLQLTTQLSTPKG